jgi:hypothetical protein
MVQQHMQNRVLQSEYNRVGRGTVNRTFLQQNLQQGRVYNLEGIREGGKGG